MRLTNVMAARAARRWKATGESMRPCGRSSHRYTLAVAVLLLLQVVAWVRVVRGPPPRGGPVRVLPSHRHDAGYELERGLAAGATGAAPRGVATAAESCVFNL